MEAVPGSSARIADVAAFAGVGVATVSRVLNGRANVAAGTRDRVLEAIKALDYRPSAIARNLSLQRTMVVGVVTPFLTNPSPIERVRGIVTALGESPYDLALFDVESAERQRRAFRMFGDAHRTDGILIVSLVPPAEEIARLASAGVAAVLVDARHDALPSVVIDDVEGGAIATRYLIELGHRRIAFIGDKPVDAFRFHSSRDRTVGYELALTQANIPLRTEYVRAGTHSRHVARSIAEELLRLPERPTAIFAASDTQALGVLEAARGLGIAVPDQLSVVGFDDIEIASFMGLTTVRQPLFESGRRGAELLLQALAGNRPAAHVETLPLDLVVRGTTRPPA
ncbi:MAG TPA: LacI family DNA-binding transcriptional regulator [Gaiellaceae bacterium]|jgi:DNA-binding LacI/PurR family transcriptional regulator|nr:LacI family DNA-binding transcriptional regulator [Gaiellaceae bacterium]